MHTSAVRTLATQRGAIQEPVPVPARMFCQLKGVQQLMQATKSHPGSMKVKLP